MFYQRVLAYARRRVYVESHRGCSLVVLWWQNSLKSLSENMNHRSICSFIVNPTSKELKSCNRYCLLWLLMYFKRYHGLLLLLILKNIPVADFSKFSVCMSGNRWCLIIECFLWQPRSVAVVDIMLPPVLKASMLINILSSKISFL